MTDNILNLFAGQDLSEELKAKVMTAFNEAVQVAVAEKETSLKESITADLKESIQAEVKAELQSAYETMTEQKIKQLEESNQDYIQNVLVGEVDKYLTASVNEWAQDNKVELEAGAKVQLAESFLHGLVQLAESHNVELPKSDMLSELNAKVSTLEESVNTLTTEKVELMTENLNLTKSKIFAETTVSLSDTQKSKIDEAVALLDFKNPEQYASAIKSIVESRFPVDVINADKLITEQNKEPVIAAPSTDNSYIGNLFKQINQQ